MVNELENRIKGNILEPLTFEEGEIDKFVRDNKCGLCGSHLLVKHAANRKWSAFCPKDGDITENNHTSVYKADQAKQSVIDGRHELRPNPKPRDAEIILKELGF